jgi:TANK-binding kinase 1
MKFIKDDGTIVYKLTDFGAARELQDDQQFVSLYGTEEYLHPDMYERAVLRKPVGKTFGATVDLWSIGVTLYHVATGNLPFRPFGGRRNKETMYHITTKKSSGVISGVQTSENGPIQWNRELPNTCLLSSGIKKHVTPLLAGLLEVNPQKMWSFERFFSEVTRFFNKKKIHIFYVNKLTELRVYLDKEERLENFQVLLQEQSEVEANSQILLFQEHLLTHHVDQSTPGTSFPDSSLSDPIVLCSKENNNITLGIDKEVPAFPALPNLVSVENDATLAKSACAVGYAYRRKVESYARCCEVVNHSVKILVEVIGSQLERLLEISEKCKSLTKITSSQMAFFNSSHASHVRIMELFSPRTEASIEAWKKRVDDLVVSEDAMRFEKCRRQLDELAPAIAQLHRRYVREHQLSREWKDATRELPSSISPAAIKAKTYVSKLKESWQHLLRDRASRTLTYNDEQFHILEKIKMQETIRVLADLLQKECAPVVSQVTELLADWYKMAQTTFLQSEILNKDICAYEDEIETFAVAVNCSQEKYEALLNEVLLSVKETQEAEEKTTQAQLQMLQQQKKAQMNGVGGSGSASVSTVQSAAASPPVAKSSRSNESNNSSSSNVQIRRALRSILTTQDEVWGIMNENSRLIEQFGQLAVASSASSLEHNSAQQILAEIDDTIGNYGH